jgi:hypothetical protein
MWAQNWRGLQDIMLPFPDKPSVDVTPNMIRKVFFSIYSTNEEFT